MENPEKIYLASFDENPKVLDRTWYPVKQYACYNTEYTRTDTFIEKACAFLETYPHMFFGVLRSDVIEDFKKYMRGE